MAKKIIKFQEDPDVLLDMAEDYSQKGKHAKAISLIKRVLKNNPHDADAKFAFSQELSNVRQYKLAQDVLFEMLTRDAEDVPVNLSLGETFYSSGNWSVAAYYFKRYSELTDLQIQSEIMQDVANFATGNNGFSIV